MVRNIINPAELGELFSDTIAIKRVSKTTKGGRVMSIAALVVVVAFGHGRVRAGDADRGKTCRFKGRCRGDGNAGAVGTEGNERVLGNDVGGCGDRVLFKRTVIA